MEETKPQKRVSIAAPDSPESSPAAATTRRPDAATSRHPASRRSMGPRQESLPPFTPDNYSSDEDDRFAHADEQSAVAPGDGWTNGALPPSFALHPYTRSGRLSLYSHHRRWINFQSSWSRIGKDSTELDAVHSRSSTGETLLTGCLVQEGKTVRALVAQLCECFYKHGWATGTGGGVSIRVGGPTENRPYRVFVAPSGVQKEDMVGDDVFELDMQRNVVAPPKTPGLRLSACTPLWYVVYERVPSAMCVIHTHSMQAQLATLLDPTERSDVLRITHLEMLKGVGNHSYDSLLEIPIIDNRPTEDLLADQLEGAISKYPKCNAVLVRRHGVYVWGDSWEQAKAQCESFDYLFETAVKMKGMGMDAGIVPKSGTYREDVECMQVGEEEKRHGDEDGPPTKRTKIAPVSAPDFNAASSTDNDVDLECSAPTTVPLVPRDAKILLLDIEGTTTSISFVKDVLFPYILKHLETHVSRMTLDALRETYGALRNDFESLDDNHPSVRLVKENAPVIDADGLDASDATALSLSLVSHVRALMAHDVKATGLKSFQGNMWKAGYDSGELVGHLYSDFMPLLRWCKSNDVRVCIFSSGSIAAQKLLFGHTSQGDVTGYFDAHFDTTSGSKKESASYRNIAERLNAKPEDVVFVSDIEAEVRAATDAGMKAVVAVRPGNARLSEDAKREFPVVRSLLQMCGAD